ncbi:MAG: sigma-70 family RNA polymerase sigma factor [Acidimicrobiia bacterium]|nr:sigma-70 family RNA polymerase sigma factor [Acidimicrobiia bacterium]
MTETTARDRDAARADRFVRRLCADHGDAVFGWALGRFADRRDAEELVAETMVRAWRHHAQYDPARGTERSWVFGIARTTAVDLYRKQRRHLRVVRDRDLDQPVPSDDERIAEATVVREALDALTEAHREVIAQAHFRGRSVREISRLLDVPEGTVKSRLYYGVRALRSALEERGVIR